jgi:hypothetical protein
MDAMSTAAGRVAQMHAEPMQIFAAVHFSL